MATTPYNVTLTDGTTFANIPTGTINQASSMTLIGKNYAEYGQLLADNFIRLLENASNTTAPPAPITGQLWWDKTTTLLKVYSGTGWKNIGGATASASQPTPSIVGDLWFNTANQQLYVCSVAGAPGTFIVVGAAVNNPGNITFAVANSVIETVASTGVYVTGLITATGNVTGSNIATSGLATVTGNIQGGNIRTAGLVSAGGTVTGSSLLGSVVSASGNVTGGNVLTGGLVSATGTVTGSSLLGSVVSASGNVTGGNVLTGGLISAAGTVNGSSLLGSVVSASGNVTGGNILTAGLISATGTVTGSFFIGDGSQLTGIGSGSIANGTSNVRVVSSGGNVTIGIGGTSNVAVYATTGEYVTGVISANGNVTGGNMLTGGFMSATGTVTGSSLLGTVVSVSGNITGSQFNGSGAGLTSIPGGNVSGTVANASYSDSAGAATTAGSATTAGTANSVAGTNVSGTVANATYAVSAGSATTAGTVTTGTQSNITGVGTLTSLSVTGNITGGNVLGGANVNATTHTGTTVSVSGNVNGGNIVTLGFVSAAGTITGATVSSTGDVLAVRTSASGNVTGGNLATGGNVTITGAGRLVAEGIYRTNYSFSSMTLEGTEYFSGTTRIVVFSGTGGTVYMPNVGGGSATTALQEYCFINRCSGTISVRYGIGGGNIGSIPTGATGIITASAANVTSASDWALSVGFNSTISVTGTVTGSQFNGSGAGLTSIPGGNVSGTVANATYATSAGSATTAGTVTTAAQGNITSVGTLTGVSTSGTVTATGNITGGNVQTGGNVTITGAGRLVAEGIYRTNYSFSSMTLEGTEYFSGTTRIVVFSGTGGTVYMPNVGGGSATTALQEYCFINRCSGTISVRYGIGGGNIGSIPTGATGIITASAANVTSASDWALSVGTSSLGLGEGGQTATYFTYPTRQANVIYTNTTGRPIFVCITLYPIQYWLNAYFYVGGNILWQYNEEGGVPPVVQVPVPVGAQYYLSMPYLVPNPSYAFYHWYELR